MDTKQPKSLGKKIGTAAIAVVAALFAIFFFYTENYYHADADARAAMQSEDGIYVSQAALGYFFDGPGSQDLLIFYPGAKVEAVSYAPLMRRLAEEGVDAFLVKMPFNLSFFGINRVSDIIRSAPDYHWYICGHSLGGVAAAAYASHHEDMLDGLILLAAYPAGEVDPSLDGLLIYGSEDRVLNRESVQKAENLWQHETCILEGGNHAGFGNYGPQAGDGISGISAREQQEAAVKRILEKIDSIKSSMLN